MALSLVTAPTGSEPISLEEARLQLRNPPIDEDALIQGILIPAALERAEGATNRQLLTATWDLRLEGFPCGAGVAGAAGAIVWPIVVPKPPLVSVTSITYVDTAGDTQTWASTKYQVSAPSGPKAAHGRIAPAYGETYPVTRGQMDAVTVRFVAGYGTASSALPARLRRAMLADISGLYAHREGFIVGTIINELPMDGAIASVYRAYKAWPVMR